MKQDKPEQGDTRHIVESLNDTIEEARANVDMLTGLGADIQVVLHLSDRDEVRNSIEIGPADRRVKIYYKDLDDLKRKLAEAREGQREAESLGLVAPRGRSKLARSYVSVPSAARSTSSTRSTATADAQPARTRTWRPSGSCCVSP